MNLKARLTYLFLVLILNAVSNNNGFDLGSWASIILFWLFAVPYLSRVSKLDYLHAKFLGLEPKDSIEEVASENATQVEDSQTQIEADEKNNQETDNEIKQIDKTHDSDSKTVKDLIMESLEGALKEFISDPPNEAYSSGNGYFSWYINICDSEDNTLSEKTGDDFCVNCDVGLLEDVVMNDSTDFTEVEADVRQCFKDYLYQSQETILMESADKVDVNKSYFNVAVFEVVDDGADVWRYYGKNHYFDVSETLNDDSSNNEYAIKKVLRDPFDLEKLDDVYKADKEVVMAAVQNGGSALEFASDSLKDDKEVVMAAVKESSFAFQYASDELKTDLDVIATGLKNYLHLDKLPDKLKADKEVVFAFVATAGENLSDVKDETLRDDKDIVKAAVRNDSSAYEYASERLKADPEIISEALKNDNCSYAFRYFDDKLKADKSLVLKAVSRDPNTLAEVSDQFKADREVVLTALQAEQNGSCLEYAADVLKDDKEIVMEACKANSAGALEYASANLRGDETFVLSVIKSCPYGDSAFPYILESLKEDREFVKKALEAHGNCYEHIAGTFQADKEMVLKFVSSADMPRYDSVLSAVPEKFHKDKDVITAELEHNGTSLASAVEIGIDIDKEMFLSILKNCISKSDIEDDHIPGALNIFKRAPDHIQADKAVVMFAIEHADTMCAKYASSELLHDRDLLLKCFEKGRMYSIDSFIPDEIRADKEFMLAAAKINPEAIGLASKELLADQELLELYLQNGCSWLSDENIAAEHKGNKELVLPAIEKDAYYLEYVSAKLKADKDVVMAAVSKQGSALEWASSELQADKEVVLAAIDNDKEAIKYASWTLLTDIDFMLSI